MQPPPKNTPSKSAVCHEMKKGLDHHEEITPKLLIGLKQNGLGDDVNLTSIQTIKMIKNCVSLS